MGRSWLSVIKLHWNSVFKRTYESNYISGKVTNKVKVLEVLLNKHPAIFTEELGTIKNLKAKLNLKSDARPKFHKARSLPFALKEVAEKEIGRLEAAGILKSVSHSDWASPLVIGPKPDGRIRICGYYKDTVNPPCYRR